MIKLCTIAVYPRCNYFNFKDAQFAHVLIIFNFKIAHCNTGFQEGTNYFTRHKFSIRSAQPASLKYAYVFTQLGIIHSIIRTIVVLSQTFSRISIYFRLITFVTASLITTFLIIWDFMSNYFFYFLHCSIKKNFSRWLMKR